FSLAKQAKELSYIFLDLVSNYSDQGLSNYKILKSGYWKKASSQVVIKKLEAFQNLILELRDQEFSQFSICVNYYNQIVVTDYFY
ncbi:7080_t:CDS:1, partial [Scutellospora calospora]